MSKLVLLATSIVVAASLAAAQDGSADHGKIMGCYFGSWAFYRYQSSPLICSVDRAWKSSPFCRPGLGKFDVDDIDPTLCTHGFYGFADIDENTYEIRVQNLGLK